MDLQCKLEKAGRLRITGNNSVRRQLFPANPDDVSTNTGDENFNNAMKERLERQSFEMSKKYNYDFKNDRPHPFADGQYVWYKNTDAFSIGIKVKKENTLTEIDLNKESSEAANLKREHETTPKSFSQSDELIVRKSKVYEKLRGIVKKRRLSF